MSTPQPDMLASVHRATTPWRWGGLIAGLLSAGCCVATDTLGRGLILAVPTLGLGMLIGVLAGELSIRPPTGTTRHAALVIRRVRDYLPTRLTPAVVAATVTITALLAITTVMGSADDQGRAGRVLLGHSPAKPVPLHGRTLWGLLTPHATNTYSPWTGSYYSIPLALVVLAGLLWAYITLHRIVRRPRPGDPITTAETDDLLRRRAARMVIGACGVLVTLPLLVVSALTAVGLLSIIDHPDSWTVGAWSLIVLIPVWVGILLASLLAIVPPRTPSSTARGVS